MATSGAGGATDGDLLLRAICENPAEDAPRLVYADWLDENGQPERAEFIRVQIELAKIPDPPVDTTAGLRAAARKQQLAALLAWKSEWRGRSAWGAKLSAVPRRPRCHANASADESS
jgi:uncharacterized protein (TIGR02996 family)